MLHLLLLDIVSVSKLLTYGFEFMAANGYLVKEEFVDPDLIDDVA